MDYSFHGHSSTKSLCIVIKRIFKRGLYYLLLQLSSYFKSEPVLESYRQNVETQLRTQDDEKEKENMTG